MSGIEMNAALIILVLLIFCLTAVAFIARRQNKSHSRNQDSSALRHLYLGSLDLSNRDQDAQNVAAPAEEVD